ncbi:MAG: response regulator transcription factor [Bacteroidales bacterium]
MKILIVEDTIIINKQIVSALEAEKIICESATNYITASEKVEIYEYDIAVIDINLPDGSGLDVIRELKAKNSKCGIIIVSARNSLDDKINGLELGADDYMTKPFAIEELIARIKAIRRRKTFDGQKSYIFSDLTINPDSKNVTIAEGESLKLTKSEYNLLVLFIDNKHRVITKETLAEHLWGDHMDMADSFDFIYSHIKNLKSKLKKAGSSVSIKAVYGVGYKIVNKN